MSIGLESQPIESEFITAELMMYVFESMPAAGSMVPLEQLADDMLETPEMILAVMDDLQADKFIGFTHNNGVVTVTYIDEEFLSQYRAFKAIRY